MQGITPPTVAQLLAAGQVPLSKFELYFKDNRLGTMNFDSGSVEPQVNEILTGATSGATAKVFSVNRTGGTWAGTNASGSIELRDCDGCFNDNEDIDGDVGGANMLTVNHPDGAVGVDKYVKNGAFVHNIDPPNDWFSLASALLSTEAGGKIGNCLKILENGADNPEAYTNAVNIEPGHIYKFSFWHKDIDGTTDDPAWYVWDVTNGAYIKNITTETANAAWTQITYTFEAPADCVFVRFYFRHSAGNGDADAYYFDEVTLYELNEWINLCDLDSKNYVESISVSLGGASMTPNPIGGKWNAGLANEGSIFHPDHPTSAYAGYCVSGREVRISIGATYGGVDYYYQRIIGYMDEPKFSAPDYKVSISGQDYMKFLADTEFGDVDDPIPNYWGTTATFSSIASTGESGIELYNEADAMDITGEVGNVANWTPSECTFVSFADVTGGSAHVGKLITTEVEPLLPTVVNDNIFVPIVGREYVFDFKYINKGALGDSLRVLIRQFDVTWLDLAEKEELYSATWKDEKLYFTARSVAPIQIWLEVYESALGAEFWVDQFSIHEFIPYDERYYTLPAAAKGPYRVLLDGVDVWYGEEDEGYAYEEATRRVAFDINKTVAVGVNNLVIHYFTTHALENVIADILVKANTALYANRAAALAAMGGPVTGISIDKVWFEVGSTCLDAVRIICERCDWRFHFAYDGSPVFAAAPAGGVVFTFTSPSQIASQRTYQDESEIKNRIVIEGFKQVEPVGKKETLLPELRGEDHDNASITAYGERSLTIKNHLFQTQAAIDAMCTALLAEYKDPKWYFDPKIPFNPVPLELGDEIQWEERLSPTLDVTQTGIIRDMKITNFITTYKLERT